MVVQSHRLVLGDHEENVIAFQVLLRWKEREQILLFPIQARQCPAQTLRTGQCQGLEFENPLVEAQCCFPPKESYLCPIHPLSLLRLGVRSVKLCGVCSPFLKNPRLLHFFCVCGGGGG